MQVWESWVAQWGKICLSLDIQLKLSAHSGGSQKPQVSSSEMFLWAIGMAGWMQPQKLIVNGNYLLAQKQKRKCPSGLAPGQLEVNLICKTCNTWHFCQDGVLIICKMSNRLLTLNSLEVALFQSLQSRVICWAKAPCLAPRIANTEKQNRVTTEYLLGEGKVTLGTVCKINIGLIRYKTYQTEFSLRMKKTSLEDRSTM